MPSLAELGRAVKAKYPGVYDKTSDADLGRAVRTKYPEAYKGYTDEPGTAAKVAKWTGETVADAAQGATALAGALDPVLAAAETGLSYMLPMARSHGSVGDRWRESMQVLRDQRAAAAQRSPIATQVGAVAPAIMAPELMAQLPAPYSQAAAQAGASLLPRAAGAVADSALFAGATTAAQNTDRPEQMMPRAEEAATSPSNLVAGALPAMAAAAPRVAYAVGRALPQATRNPQATYLRQQGLGNMTLAQEATPDSPLAIWERATADKAFGMAPERAAARTEAVRVLQDKVRAPNAPPLAAGDLQARHAELVKGFGPDYAQVSGQKVPGADLAALPESALTYNQGNVTKSERVGARNEIGDALTVLPDVNYAGGKAEVRGLTPEAPEPFALMKPARGGEAYWGGEFPAPPARGRVLPEASRKERLATAAVRAQGRQMAGPPDSRTIPGTGRPNPDWEWRTATEEPTPPREYTVGDLVNVRTRIRESIRDARSGQAPNWPRVRQLEHAEDVISSAIDEHLSPALRNLHQATDRQYAKMMVLEGAGTAANPEITGNQGLQSLARSTSRRALKSGQGGDLQQYFEAMRDTLPDLPFTGGRETILKDMPGMRYWGAPLVRFANQPNVRAGVFREPGPVTPMPTDAKTAQAVALANALRLGRGEQ